MCSSRALAMESNIIRSSDSSLKRFRIKQLWGKRMYENTYLFHQTKSKLSFLFLKTDILLEHQLLSLEVNNAQIFLLSILLRFYQYYSNILDAFFEK